MKYIIIIHTLLLLTITSYASTRTGMICEFKEKSINVRMKFVVLNIEKKNKVTIEESAKC